MTGKGRLSIRHLLEKKQKQEKIVALTAYDFSMARLLDEAGVDLLLVGDSLGMVMLGYKNTLPVTMEEMLHHTKAVSRGTETAIVVGDMPYLSYQVSETQALENAGRFLKEANATAVKLEGGSEVAGVVRKLTGFGIPVMGHLGLTPQYINQLGGYRAQGKDAQAAERIKKDALLLQDAGIFALVLEYTPASLAASITQSLEIPVIGIGAGAQCDGQILVTHDLLGLYGLMKPKFVKQYADLGAELKRAVTAYAEEVKTGKFPGEQHSL